MIATVKSVHTAGVSLAVRPDLVVVGARGAHDRSDFLLVRVETSAGISGIGEVSATLSWSGEDAVTAEHVIRQVLAPAIIGQPLVPVAALQSRMDLALAGNPFTKAGMSIALWDAYARTLDVPLAAALGGPFRTEVPIKCSLSGDGERLRRVHAAARAAGFASFKVKIGMDVDADSERVALARGLAGPQTLLGLDANGGYSRRDAERALERVRGHGPAFLEQPVEPGDLEGMRELRGRGLPIVADESVFGMGDLVHVVRAQACDVVSLYVGKSGGPEQAVAMGRVAEAFGVEVLIGSNGELGVGAAAQLHVACALPRLCEDIPSDIIGAYYYDEDVLAAPLDSDGVRVRLPDAPGLGVELQEDVRELLR
ncbi:mandelate racemase [Nonomuraea basaltis]|nr:mandelate racemase [Nonomuraea basaltis]